MKTVDVIIIGAGAAGLMCAIEAGKRKRQVIVLDHANKPGKKILMSGGGRCNFTNYDVNPDSFISHNPHFLKSALSRYTQWDFIRLVKDHHIPFHEKTQGQLFCDNKSSDIVNMLLRECEHAHASIQLNTHINKIEKTADKKFLLTTSSGMMCCDSLVIATGGLSIPTMGASPFGYKVAEQFGIKVWPVRAALVPFTLQEKDKERYASLSGVSLECSVSTQHQQFYENMLFTHRGLSGPAMLQISSYWESHEGISINLLPNINLLSELKSAHLKQPQQLLKTFLSHYFPKRFVIAFLDEIFAEKTLQTLSHLQFEQLADLFHHWKIKPNGTEGYRTAEVTLGGVDCNAISSKTMEALNHPGLYFIGEVLDVTGWLGGYNFQWAWSSGYVCGQVI